MITGCIRTFPRNELRDSLDFRWDGNRDGCHPLRIDDGNSYEVKLQSLVAKMSIDGTLCIRQYAAELTEANFDYQHLTSNGQSVILGSSWAGALRDCEGRVLSMLKMNKEQVEQTVRELFGYVVDEKPMKMKKGTQDKRVAYPSNCVIDETQSRADIPSCLHAQRLIDSPAVQPMALTLLNKFNGRQYGVASWR